MDEHAVKTILAILIFVPFCFIYVASIVWAYRDAESRGKSGCLVAVLVMFLSWPIGLLAWIIFRPDDGQQMPRD